MDKSIIRQKTIIIIYNLKFYKNGGLTIMEAIKNKETTMIVIQNETPMTIPVKNQIQ